MYSLKYKFLVIFIIFLGCLGYFSSFFENTFIKNNNTNILSNELLGIEENILNKFVILHLLCM